LSISDHELSVLEQLSGQVSMLLTSLDVAIVFGMLSWERVSIKSHLEGHTTHHCCYDGWRVDDESPIYSLVKQGSLYNFPLDA